MSLHNSPNSKQAAVEVANMHTCHLSLLPLPHHFIHSPTHPFDTLITLPSLDVIKRHLELQMKTTVGMQICVPTVCASSPPSLRNHSPFPHLHSPLPPLPQCHPTANGNCQTN